MSVAKCDQNVVLKYLVMVTVKFRVAESVRANRPLIRHVDSSSVRFRADHAIRAI